MSGFLQVGLGAAASALIATATLPAAPAQADSPQAAFSFSTDAGIASQQRAAHDVVARYAQLMKAGDTAGILDLYAPDGIAEWNETQTLTTREERREAYDQLFKTAKMSPSLGFASIDIYGDIAVVRTYHHRGDNVLTRGKEIPDSNREVFILRKTGEDYKIRLYIFNKNVVQDEG